MGQLYNGQLVVALRMLQNLSLKALVIALLLSCPKLEQTAAASGLTTRMNELELHRPWRRRMMSSGSPGIVSKDAAPASNNASCPFDFSTIDWTMSPASPTANATCIYVYGVLGLLLTPYIRSTTNLMLPNNATAQTCLDEMKVQFDQRSTIPGDAIASCGVRASFLSADPNKCAGIKTITDFQEKVVNEKDMEKKCNGSTPTRTGSVDCTACSAAMARAYLTTFPETNNTEDCVFLFVHYVLSVLNTPGELSTASTACVGTSLLEFVIGEQPRGSTPFPNLPGAGSPEAGAPFPKLYQAGFAAGSAAIVVTMLLAISMHMSRRMKRYRIEMELINSKTDAAKDHLRGTAISWFTYDEIKMATCNFCPSNLIGKGGYGSVYKGALVDGSLIAVKKFRNAADIFGGSFVPELEVISRVRHRNLVVLRGCSIAYGMAEGHQLLLVYDYMPNGSLKDYLFDGSKPPLLWKERRKIAIGIAAGLAYLHHESKPAIIHRDVKAANILLDDNLDALVADFGLARFKPEGITHITTQVAGTLGYVAPEYAFFGQLTNKSDVYSFGILLLELISGQIALNMFLSSDSLENSLISHWAHDLLKKGKMEDIVDKKMRHAGDCINPEFSQEMRSFIKVALLCAHSGHASRPTMAMALRMLKGEVPVPDIVDFPDAGSVRDPRLSSDDSLPLTPDLLSLEESSTHTIVDIRDSMEKPMLKDSSERSSAAMKDMEKPILKESTQESYRASQEMELPMLKDSSQGS